MEPITAALLASSAATGIANTALGASAPKRQYKWNKKAMYDQNSLNRENLDYTLARQRELQEEARQYDSPKAQMQRYIEAGLNPNLIYGSATASNAYPIDFGKIAPARLDAPDASIQLPDVAGSFIRNAQAINSANLTEAKTQESLIRQQAITLQNKIAENNPMLNPDVASKVSWMMEETAREKAMTSWGITHKRTEDGELLVYSKVRAQVEEQLQKLGLNTKDLAIKNRILESKEFENAIKEIQAKFLQSGDITPEHIRQALMLILGKMF